MIPHTVCDTLIITMILLSMCRSTYLTRTCIKIWEQFLKGYFHTCPCQVQVLRHINIIVIMSVSPTVCGIISFLSHGIMFIYFVISICFRIYIGIGLLSGIFIIRLYNCHPLVTCLQSVCFTKHMHRARDNPYTTLSTYKCSKCIYYHTSNLAEVSP